MRQRQSRIVLIVAGPFLGASVLGCGSEKAHGGIGGAANADGGSGGASGNSPGVGGNAGSGGVAAVPTPQLAATTHGTCALDAQGAIHCWGLARIGSGPWQIPEGSFTALFSSTSSVCAVRSDGTFTCFAEPLGTPDFSYVPNTAVRKVALAVGDLCGIDLGGAAFCSWAPASAIEGYALPVPNGVRPSDISVGTQFACGIGSADGAIHCWGSQGSADACGFAPRAGQLDAPDGTFVAVTSRMFSSCGIKSDGSLACWGAGKAGDDRTAMHCDTPYNFGQSVPPQGRFTGVAVGENHACGLSEGKIVCWGAGDGTLVDCPTGNQCNQSVPPDGSFAEVAVGGLHSCAMTADRTVQCWGWDGDGDGRTTPPAAFQ